MFRASRKGDHWRLGTVSFLPACDATGGHQAMSNDSLARLTDAAARFANEREWRQFHTPKGPALEAAELAELNSSRILRLTRSSVTAPCP